MAVPSFYAHVAKKLLSWNVFNQSKLCMSSRASVSTLAKLRKMTGYSMSNCKKALELHADDIERAKTWLDEEAKKQGWSKIANLENRPAAQGLVAVYNSDSIGAMVEVNCETDFVSRNTEFQAFVTKVLSSCINYSLGNTEREGCHKLHLNSESLNKLPFDSGTLGDLTAAAVGKFGEKTVLRRAVCFKAGDGVFLSSFSHPHTQCADLTQGSFGKYGVLVAYRTANILPDVTNEMVLKCGDQLCQHIIGMNPNSIGDVQLAIKSAKEKLVEEKIVAKKLEADDRKDDIIVSDNKPAEQEADHDVDEEDDQNQADDNTKLADSNESRLVFQQYLMDPTINVAEYLVDNSLEVVDFQRFECGETDSN